MGGPNATWQFVLLNIKIKPSEGICLVECGTVGPEGNIRDRQYTWSWSVPWTWAESRKGNVSAGGQDEKDEMRRKLRTLDVSSNRKESRWCNSTAIQRLKRKSCSINALFPIRHPRSFCPLKFEPKRLWEILFSFHLCLCQHLFLSDVFAAGDWALWLPSV